MKAAEERIPILDNMKGILIICVVLGHLCRVVGFPGSKVLYCTIYLFHMPAFVFISGYCCNAKGSIIEICKKYLYPYFIWQALYLLFCRYVLGTNDFIQFHDPYWHLWYLLSLFFWHFIILFLKTDSKLKKVLYVGFSFLAGILVGFVEAEYEILSFSRTVVFFVFFLVGYYCKEIAIFNKPKLWLKTIAITLTIFIFFVLCWNLDIVNDKWLFHHYPYGLYDYNWWIRFLLLIAGGIITMFLCMVSPKKRVPVLTYIGQNTMSIFLLHGFIILFMKNEPAIRTFCMAHPSSLFVCAFIIVIVFSSPLVLKLIKPFVRWPFGSNKRNIF